MKLIDLIDTFKKGIFLVDASGVLYSSNGFLPESNKTFTYLQSKGETFLASNNSYHYINDIANNLNIEGQINISPTHIISSGQGLAKDPKIKKILNHKLVYFIGTPSGQQYSLDAPIKCITNSLKKADVIILAGLNESQAKSTITKIINIAKTNPNIPIICCNKDHYIRAHNRLQPVVGYFAQEIENNINRPIIWFGKPLKNFSKLVKNQLKTQKLIPNKNTLFFDDNLENVIAMQKHLTISGCWIKDTGILYNQNENDLIKKYGKPTYSISSFNLNKTITTY